MIKIIPAIDIIDGKCVRLCQGDYEQKTVYHDDPVEVALEFERYGIHRIHVVDLDGARSKHVVNYRILARISRQTTLKVDFGGGIKSDGDISIAFENGASQVTIGSIAVQQPDLFMQWLKKYSPEHIILGADVKNGCISVNGWKEDSGEELIPFLRKYVSAGVNRVLCTDISRDGMMEGPAITLYQEILKEFPQLKLTASGGVRSMDDIEALDAAGLHSVVVGKAIYEGNITLKQINEYLLSHKERI